MKKKPTVKKKAKRARRTAKKKRARFNDNLAKPASEGAGTDPGDTKPPVNDAPDPPAAETTCQDIDDAIGESNNFASGEGEEEEETDPA